MWNAKGLARTRPSWSAMIALCTAVGCTQTDAVAPRQPVSEPSISTTETLNDSTFTHFAAKVTMTVTGAQSLDRTDVVRTMIYHIDRTLQGNATWRTITSFDSAAPFGRPVAGGASTVDIGSVVTTSDNSVAQVYNRQGLALAAPTPIDLSSLVSGRSQFDSPNRASIPPFPARPPAGNVVAINQGVSANVAAPTGTASVSDPRAWIRNIVVVPQRRATVRASIVAALGAPVSKVASLDRFTLVRDGKLFEQLVDPQTQVVTEENIAEHGVLQVHTQYRYLSLQNGTMVRVGTHTQVASPSGGRRAVIDVTYSNISLDTIGGVK